MKNLTVKQYADLRKITPSAVRKAIRLGHNLPGAKRISSFGKSYMVTVSDRFVRDQKKV